MDCIERSKIELRPHQKKAIKYLFSKTSGLLLIHPTGSGKTLTAVAASQCFLDQFPDNRVIFVGPTSVLDNFKKELAKYGVKNYQKYTIYSYQRFTNLEEEKRDKMCDKNMLIVDEVHNLRNLEYKSESKGQRSKAVLRCALFAKKRLLLSATPFVNDLTDFIPIINYIYGQVLVFKKSDVNNIKKVIPYLTKKIDFIDISNKAKKEYPKFKEHFIRIKMDEDYQEDYCKIIKGFEVKGDRFQNPQSFYNAHRRAVNKIGKGNIYFSEKTRRAIKIIGEKKTIIFSNWLDFGLRPIKKELDAKGITSETFSGDLTTRERTKIINNFNKNKFQVLIISRSGMEGIDLKEIRNVIVMDPVWNYAGIQQIRGRAVRYRSHEKLPPDERKVDVYYMILETGRKDCKSGDTVVYGIVKRKEKEFLMLEKELKTISI